MFDSQTAPIDARRITQELRGAVAHEGDARDRPPPPKRGLHFRDSEALEWFAAKGQDLVQRSPLGAQLERLHDEVGMSNGLPSTNPTWILDFSEHTDSARARRIAMRLLRASAVYRPASCVLLAYHDPVAVGLDGIVLESSDGTKTARGKLDIGRTLALYPCTETAREARRWKTCADERAAANAAARFLAGLAGVKLKSPPDAIERVSQVMTLSGRSPGDALRLMAATRRGAKGDEKGVWGRINREAIEMLRLAVEAWLAVKDEVERETFAGGAEVASLRRCAADALPAVETRRGIGL